MAQKYNEKDTTNNKKINLFWGYYMRFIFFSSKDTDI